jgi:hypothetical protein
MIKIGALILAMAATVPLPPVDITSRPRSFRSGEEAASHYLDSFPSGTPYGQLVRRWADHETSGRAHAKTLAATAGSTAITSFLMTHVEPAEAEGLKVRVPVALHAVKVGKARLWAIVFAWEFRLNAPETGALSHTEVFVVDPDTGYEVAHVSCG